MLIVRLKFTTTPCPPLSCHSPLIIWSLCTLRMLSFPLRLLQITIHSLQFFLTLSSLSLFKMVVSGACISGQVRTFFLPCVGERMRDNILVPLNLRTHVFLHGKNISEHDVRKTLHGAEVKTVVVMRPQSPTPPCPTRVPGYPLTRFLFLCYRALMKDSVEYEWVVRLRSDQNIPFTFRILPPASMYYKLHPWATGIMISGLLSDCNCGWKKRKCLSKIPTRCEWVDDQFALLHGSAVKSYFHDLHVSFCNHGFFNVPLNIHWVLHFQRRDYHLHFIMLACTTFVS